MAKKQVKNNSLAARTDDKFFGEVGDYLTAAKMQMADLVRRSVSEFMTNHPVKVSRVDKETNKSINQLSGKEE